MTPNTPPGQDRRKFAPNHWWLAGIVLLGAALRIAPLTDNRLHPDEALFASLGRLIIEGYDPWLQHTWLLVDKPPLFYYLLAGSISISWASELTARLPGLFASILSIALVAQLARRLWHSHTAAAAAALFFALSPFAISFSPTAFADPLMAMWLIAALAAMSARRWGWSGVLFGCALATKQSAVFFAPLLLAVGIVQSARVDTGWRDAGRWGLQFALGCSIMIAMMAGWEAVRQVEHGVWEAGLDANNPGRLIRSREVWARAIGWWQWAGYIGGTPALTAGIGVGLAALGSTEVKRRHERGAAATLILIAYLLGYIALHWLVAFPVLDRYLLPVVPIVALLVGRGIQRLAAVTGSIGVLGQHRNAALMIAGITIAGLMAPQAIRAAGSGVPVGGDHGAYDGIDTVATYVRSLPEGTVIYYDSLGWTLQYYLFDSYVFPSSFGSPAALSADLLTFGEGDAERYLVLPGWQSHTEILTAVTDAGFMPEQVLETTNRFGETSFVVYQLIPPHTDVKDR